MANVVLKPPLVTFCSREQGGYWDLLASFLECISICILYNESPNPSHITYALITLCSPKIALIVFASAGVAPYDEQYFICKQRRQIAGTWGGRNWLSWIWYSTPVKCGVASWWEIDSQELGWTKAIFTVFSRTCQVWSLPFNSLVNGFLACV